MSASWEYCELPWLHFSFSPHNKFINIVVLRWFKLKSTMLKKQIHDMQLKSEFSEVTLRINNNDGPFSSDRGFPASVWLTGQKQVTQKVYTRFPADSWPSCSHVTATEAWCKVVSQYRSLIMLLLQTSPEPLGLILASKDFVAIQQGTLGRSESRWREKCGRRVLLAVDM